MCLLRRDRALNHCWCDWLARRVWPALNLAMPTLLDTFLCRSLSFFVCRALLSPTPIDFAFLSFQALSEKEAQDAKEALKKDPTFGTGEDELFIVFRLCYC